MPGLRWTRNVADHAKRRDSAVFRPAHREHDASRRSRWVLIFQGDGNAEPLDSQNGQIRSWIATHQLRVGLGPIRKSHADAFIPAKRVIRRDDDLRAPVDPARIESLARVNRHDRLCGLLHRGSDLFGKRD